MNPQIFSQQLLSATTTGFEAHPNKTNYHGFTCPMCGRHEFGTSEIMSTGVRVGQCNGQHHGGPTCSFSWNRINEVDEANAMHEMTHEEYLSHLNKEQTSL